MVSTPKLDFSVLRTAVECLSARSLSAVMEESGAACVADLLRARAVGKLAWHVARLAQQESGAGLRDAAAQLARCVLEQEDEDSLEEDNQEGARGRASSSEPLERWLRRLVTPLVNLAASGSVLGQEQVRVGMLDWFC